LELGCAVGGNIIPMAYALAGSRFMGIDISQRQIEAGQETIRLLGLDNISLRAADIREITPEWGKFDYIIAHGVYSWVPADVREALLSVCRRNLAPNGIAYVSYNTFPGWHMLAGAREMMLYHTRHEPDPIRKANEARRLIAFLKDSIPERTDAYGSFLDSYSNLLGRRVEKASESSDALLLHDELERVNDPVYFHQFAAQASAHGLQYLGEADFSAMLPANFKSETIQWLQRTARDLIEMEQYMDFVRNRTFRQTLLCHAERKVQRRLQADPAFLSQFSFNSRAVPEQQDIDVSAAGPARFRAPDGAMLNTDHPVSKAAMLALAKDTPRAMPFRELFRQAQHDVYGDRPATVPVEQDLAAFSANLLRSFTYSHQLIDIYRYTPPFITQVNARPVASAYARLQAMRGETNVTNLLHERVSLDAVTLLLLPLANGEHDFQEMVAHLQQFADSTGASLEDKAGDEGAFRQQLEDEVRRGLQWLGRAALLIA
jgi:methyltransferase-like protein/SAM-dependent methyltransferase